MPTCSQLPMSLPPIMQTLTVLSLMLQLYAFARTIETKNVTKGSIAITPISANRIQ